MSRKSVSGSNRDGGSSKAKAQGSEETRRGQAGSSGAVNAGKGKEPADEDELVVPAGGKEEERKDLARRGLVGGVGKESEKSRYREERRRIKRKEKEKKRGRERRKEKRREEKRRQYNRIAQKR